MKTKASRNFVLIAIAVLANFMFTQLTFATVTGPGTAWQYCRSISLSPVTPSVNFQVKVTLTTAGLGNPYSNMKADGSDLRFYDINNNICNYWFEAWTNTGTSTIWVKVPTSGASVIFLYYGNANAAAASDGANVFDFFDDFTSSLGSKWTTISSGGSVTQSGTVVTLSNTNGGTVSLSNTSAFTPSSTSFFLEAKHREGGYNRNRFYATTGTNGGSVIAVGDYGYFTNAGNTTAQVFWGTFPGTTSLNVNTDYLTRWQITDGSTYNWNTLLYSTGAAVTNGTRTTTFGSVIRYISIEVTEQASTSTIVDWIRVRKFAASEPAATVGSSVTNVSASITAHTNVLCNGLPTGSATVTATGGSGVYTYLWNSSPAQTTQIATTLAAGNYIATVTENSIGISDTAKVTITQSVVLLANITNKTNITCFAANDGTITIHASGGLSPYSFSVDNGATWKASETSTYTFGGLVPNNPYRIKIKDSNGCVSK